MKNLIGFVVLLAAILGCSSFGKKETANSGAPAPAKSDAPPTAGASDITLEKYGRLTLGMKYDEVVKILGSAGTELSSSASGSNKYASYKWTGANNSSITLAMKNDVISTKNHSNLQTTAGMPKSDLTLAKYEQLQTGMAYPEAVKIIGSEGAQTSDSYSDSLKTTSYRWEAEKFGKIYINLTDGKISSKSQGNLK